MAQTLGIENIKKVIKAAAEVGNFIGGILGDGKWTPADVIEFQHLWPIISELTSMEYDKFVPEIKDLSPEEAQEMIAYFCECFDIPQDFVEEPLEFCMTFVGNSISFVLDLIKLIKASKK